MISQDFFVCARAKLSLAKVNDFLDYCGNFKHRQTEFTVFFRTRNGKQLKTLRGRFQMEIHQCNVVMHQLSEIGPIMHFGAVSALVISEPSAIKSNAVLVQVAAL